LIAKGVIIDHMDVRSVIIEAAAKLLAESPTGDISTRAVSEAAGVQQPVLYRHFGDKDGLLAAVVDYGFEHYLESKRSGIKADDPVEDLRAGWDGHTAFALANPNFYRLMYSPTIRVIPDAANESLRLLVEILERIAEQGRLRVPVETAAQMVMSANTGVALALITRPTFYPDASLSALVRDALLSAILTDVPVPSSTDSARTAAATTLISGVDDLAGGLFTTAEAGLFREWLTRIGDARAR